MGICETLSNAKQSCVPALRCKGPAYFVLSTFDLDKPVNERQFCRFLLDTERYVFQGHDDVMHGFWTDRGQSLAASGNAFPIGMACKAIAPLLSEVSRSGVLNMNSENRVLSAQDQMDLAGKLAENSLDGASDTQILPRRKRRRS